MNRNLKIVLDTNALIDLWTQDAEAFQAMLPSRDSSSNFFVPGSIRRELKSRSVNTEESEEVRNLCDKLTRVLQNEKSKSGAAFSEEMPPARGGTHKFNADTELRKWVRDHVAVFQIEVWTSDRKLVGNMLNDRIAESDDSSSAMAEYRESWGSLRVFKPDNKTFGKTHTWHAARCVRCGKTAALVEYEIRNILDGRTAPQNPSEPLCASCFKIFKEDGEAALPPHKRFPEDSLPHSPEIVLALDAEMRVREAERERRRESEASRLVKKRTNPGADKTKAASARQAERGRENPERGAPQVEIDAAKLETKPTQKKPISFRRKAEIAGAILLVVAVGGAVVLKSLRK